MQWNQWAIGFLEGQYTFSQFGTSQPQTAGTGHSYASYLLGLVNAATVASNTRAGDRSKYYAVYAQDDWKLTRTLTLNYGLRWEVQPPFYEVAGRTSIMDPTVPNSGAAGRPGAVIFAGDGPGHVGGRRFMKTYFGGISPRLGLAWQLGSKTVVRTGYGTYYSPLVDVKINRQGYNASITINSQDGGLTPVFQIDRGWPAGVVKPPPFIDPTVANGQAATTAETCRGCSGRLARTSQWQFGVQHTLRDILVEASYVATVAHGIGNEALVSINQVAPSYLSLGSLLTRNISDAAVRAAGFGPPYAGFNGTLAQSLRAFPQYLGVTTLDAPTGNSTYHALLVKSEKRFSNGLQFLISYAFSKTIADVHIAGDVDLSGAQDQYNRRLEKSISNSDIPQVFVTSFSYELPFGRGKHFLRQRVPSLLFGGWSISGILSYQAGGVLGLTLPNNLPIFNGQLRPNRVAGVPIRVGPGHADFQPLNTLSGQTGDLFLDRAAFAVPAPFTFGSLGVALPDVRGFGSRGEDMSIIRRFRALERYTIEFRGDFFNAFNRKNLNNPVTDMTNSNFGRVTGQGPARIVQLGLRLDF